MSLQTELVSFLRKCFPGAVIHEETIPGGETPGAYAVRWEPQRTDIEGALVAYIAGWTERGTTRAGRGASEGSKFEHRNIAEKFFDGRPDDEPKERVAVRAFAAWLDAKVTAELPASLIVAHESLAAEHALTGRYEGALMSVISADSLSYAKDVAKVALGVSQKRITDQLAVDAAKWRALRNCPRITAMGSAGLTGSPQPNHYAHVTLNFWTQADEPGPAWATEWLDSFVEIAQRAQAMNTSTGATAVSPGTPPDKQPPAAADSAAGSMNDVRDATRYRWIAADPGHRASLEWLNDKAEMDEHVDQQMVIDPRMIVEPESIGDSGFVLEGHADYTFGGGGLPSNPDEKP